MLALSRIAVRTVAASNAPHFFPTSLGIGLLGQRGTPSLLATRHFGRGLGNTGGRCRFFTGFGNSKPPKVGEKVDEDRAKAGTEAWVREWVIAQDMCPFAAQSNCKIVPFCADDHVDFIEEFVLLVSKEAHSLLERIEDKDDLPSTLLVIPNYLPLQSAITFEEMIHLMTDPDSQNNGLVCGPLHLMCGSKAPMVMQFFHPKMDHSMVENLPEDFGDTNALKYTLRSPWPTIQLLASSDLKKKWNGGDAVSEKILRRNAKTVSKIGSQELEKRLEAFRNTFA